MRAIREDGAVQPYRPRPSSPASGSIRRAELDRLLEFAVHDTGVLAGAIFLLASHGEALRLEMTAGPPAEYLAPLSRVALSRPVPVREALRQRRLVWLSDPEEFAQAYPRTAIALPYHCAAAAAPIITGTRAWGTPLLLWPGSDTAGATAATYQPWAPNGPRTTCVCGGRCRPSATQPSSTTLSLPLATVPQHGGR
ncbi:hypothetical protein [Streptomyces mirabilis]